MHFLFILLFIIKNSFDILPNISHLKTIYIPIIDIGTNFQKVFESIIWHYFVTSDIGGQGLTKLVTNGDKGEGVPKFLILR